MLSAGYAGANAGLLPLTLSPGGDPSRHQLGGVLTSLPSTIITHFLNWAFQAVGPDGAAAVAELVVQHARVALEAIEGELARREVERSTPTGSGHARFSETPLDYRSLPRYSIRQLEIGRERLRRALDSGAWEMRFEGGELRFASRRGRWQERNGAAFWTTPDDFDPSKP